MVSFLAMFNLIAGGMIDLGLTRGDYLLAAICVGLIAALSAAAVVMLTANSIREAFKGDRASYCLLMLLLALVGIALRG